VAPTPTAGKGSERVVAFSGEVAAELLGLDPKECETQAFAALFSGNVAEADLPAGMRPYAAAYAGHQFGSFAGQLGDGRAICLGDVESSSCPSSPSSSSSSSSPSLPPSPPFPPYPLPTPSRLYELQLKGAGTTPYSRFADGRAVLRSSVREFVASEAMSSLGIPTTRALSLALTGDRVVRDQFYDGRAKLELGAVVCRVSPCFVRFGSFELPAARGDPALARELLDFVVAKHYPHLLAAASASSDSSSSESPGLPLLLEVAERTGRTVAAWQACGFVHGVLNTVRRREEVEVFLLPERERKESEKVKKKKPGFFTHQLFFFFNSTSTPLSHLRTTAPSSARPSTTAPTAGSRPSTSTSRPTPRTSRGGATRSAVSPRPLRGTSSGSPLRS